jgi:hypothetical protein
VDYFHQVLGFLGVQPQDPLKAPARPELSSFGMVNERLLAEYEGKTRSAVVKIWWTAVEVNNRLLLNVWT